MARILILTPQLPYPPHQGTTIRNYNLIVELAKRHTINLLSLIQPTDPPAAETPLVTLCRSVHTAPAPAPRGIQQRLKTTLFSRLPDMGLRLANVSAFQELLLNLVQTNNYGVLQIEGIEMAPYALWLQGQPAWAALKNAGLRMVFDDHNAEFRLQERTARADLRTPKRWVGAFYSLIQWQKLRSYEQRVCTQADHVVAVSSADAHALRSLLPKLKITVVPNGVDLATYTPDFQKTAPKTEQPTLVFTGKMDYRPNVDAVLWFAEKILPLVQAKVPAVRFIVVGQQPHARLQHLQKNTSITLTGRVPDVRPHLAEATVCVLPFRMGSGTRLKVLESLAMGKAVVSTTLGAEGFDFHDAQELRFADDETTFALRVIELLNDPAERARLGANARAFVEANCGWNRIVPRLEAVYASRNG